MPCLADSGVGSPAPLRTKGVVSSLETRPIYDKRDETIRGYVFCSFPARVLRKGLQDRLSARGEVVEWADVTRDLEQKRCNISDVAYALNCPQTKLGSRCAPDLDVSFEPGGFDQPEDTVDRDLLEAAGQDPCHRSSRRRRPANRQLRTRPRSSPEA